MGRQLALLLRTRTALVTPQLRTETDMATPLVPRHRTLTTLATPRRLTVMPMAIRLVPPEVTQTVLETPLQHIPTLMAEALDLLTVIQMATVTDRRLTMMPMDVV